MRAYRKRGSRKADDRIEAIKFNGFQALPTDRRGKPTMPAWMPQVERVVIDAEGTYDSDEIDATPAGEVWRLGDRIARFGIADGHLDATPGDFIVRYADGHVAPLRPEQLHQNYRAV